VTIAKEIELKDPFENMGAQLVKEVATKTNDVAGDGTTTATLLAQAMIREGLKNLAAGANPMVMKKGMARRPPTAAVTPRSRSISKKVNGSKDIARVGTISSGDELIGKLIAEAMEKVSARRRHHHRGVQDRRDLQRRGGRHAVRPRLYHPYMVTDTEKMEAVLDDAYILITDKKISNIQDHPASAGADRAGGKKLLIIAEDVEGEALPP
jgi:chaperonin GroEL